MNQAIQTLATPKPLDLQAIRNDFPVLDQQVHGKPLVYLDNAASSQKPVQVQQTMNDYYSHDHANVHRGVHSLSQRATDAFEGARTKVKEFLGAANEKEIIFVRSATEGLNLIASSYGRMVLKEGDEVLITVLEHHSNIVPWQLICEQTGATLKSVDVNDAGELDLEQYKSLLTEKTKIAAFNHVSNALGTINPVKKMVKLAQEVGVTTVIDGSQAAPHLVIDVQDSDCDFYVITGHKMFGPTGIGVVYGKQALLDAMPPYQGGGEMIKQVSLEKSTYAELPAKFEAGTPDIAGSIGLAAAIDYMHNIGIENIAAHEHALLEYATEKASEIKELRIIGTAKDKAAVLSFVIEGIHPHDLGTILDNEGVAVRTGHHCAQPLMKRFNVPATARASFAMYNTFEEVDALMAAIKKAIEMFS